MNEWKGNGRNNIKRIGGFRRGNEVCVECERLQLKLRLQEALNEARGDLRGESLKSPNKWR